MLEKDSVVVVSSNLTSADLGGEAVVLDLDEGTYYGLNEVGTRILELMKQPTPVSSIIESLQEEYEVDRSDLENDILNFLANMIESKLVRIVNASVS